MHTTRIRGLIDWMKSLSIEDRCYNPYLIKLKTIKKGLKLPKCQSNWYLLLFRSSRTIMKQDIIGQDLWNVTEKGDISTCVLLLHWSSTILMVLNNELVYESFSWRNPRMNRFNPDFPPLDYLHFLPYNISNRKYILHLHWPTSNITWYRNGGKVTM